MIDKKLNYGRHIIREFAQKIQNYKTVLDSGAGQGDDLEIYRLVNLYAKLFALEEFESNINMLNSRGIEASKCNIEKQKFPFDDESIDVINANQILEHTKEIFWIFHEATRTLRTGGYLVLGVPNLASLHNRFLLALGKQPTSIKNSYAHLRAFTKGDLIEFINIWGGTS